MFQCLHRSKVYIPISTNRVKETKNEMDPTTWAAHRLLGLGTSVVRTPVYKYYTAYETAHRRRRIESFIMRNYVLLFDYPRGNMEIIAIVVVVVVATAPL